MTDLKVEPAIAKDHQKVQSIRVYPGKVLKQEIDSSVERGETPSLIVKKEFSKRRKVEEVSLVLEGPYHIENLGYYTKPPETWTTWGEIYMTPAQALQLAQKIKQITKAPAGEPGQMVLVKIANMVIDSRAFERLIATTISERHSHQTARSRRRRR